MKLSDQCIEITAVCTGEFSLDIFYCSFRLCSCYYSRENEIQNSSTKVQLRSSTGKGCDFEC